MESRIAKQGADRAGSARSGVQSVETAGTILRALATAGGVLALRDLAAACGMGRAKVHRYLVSLKRAGLVAQDERSGLYRIGSAAVTVGLVGLGSLSPLRHVTEALPALRDRVDQTVTAAIWGDMGPTIVAMEEPSRTVTMNIRVGSSLPLYNSAIGNVFAAFMPAATVRELVAERPDFHGAGSGDRATIVADVRARRMSRNRGSLMPGIDALAAPVVDYRGKTIAVVCVIGRSEEIDIDWQAPPARGLAAATADMSRALGFVPLTDPATRRQNRG